MTKRATVAEQRHMNAVRNLGCIICRRVHGVVTRPEDTCVHHIKHHCGIGRKSSHYETLPLCWPHHDGGEVGVAFHAAPRTWEANFGRQVDLLAEVMKELDQ